MAQETHTWIRADLQRLPDDGNKYEVVRGELFVTPAPRARHQEIIAVLALHLSRYVQEQELGRVHQARAVIVFDGSEVEPDIMVRPAVPPPPPEWEDAPLPFLVVEVLSGSTRRRDHVQKRSLYVDAGVSEYWIVDGEHRTIRVIRPGQDDDIVSELLQWHPTGASEPLVLDVAGIFREALG